MASRALGYLRDAGIMYVFGAGATADAYYAAFRIANFFRRTLGEGALNASFVPVLAQERLKGPEETRRFLGALWSLTLLAAGLLCAGGALLARPLVLALTWGFKGRGDMLDLTVTLTRIFFAHVFLVIVSALCQGSLNVARRFFVAAMAPTAFSLSILAYLGALRLGLVPAGIGVRGLAWVATLSGLIQLAALWRPLKKEGLAPTLGRPGDHPGVRQVAAMMGPSMIGAATDQLDAFVDTICASFLESGSMTAIYNASRLMQLPLALFGVATAAVALPQLSEHAGRGEMKEYGATLNLALRLLAFILLPAAVGLVLVALPITRLLFEHGQFTPAASVMTAGTLRFYGLGLVAYAGTKVLVFSFYSLRDAKTPLRATFAEMALNAALSVALMGRMRVSGLALASAIAAWLGCGMNFYFLNKRTGFAGLERTFLPMLRSLAAAVGMGAAVLGILAIAPAKPLVQVALAVPGGVAAYAALAELLDIEERHHLWQFLNRKSSLAPTGRGLG